MAKRKRVKRVRRIVHKVPDNRRLSVLLLMLALAVFVFAAVVMTRGGI